MVFKYALVLSLFIVFQSSAQSVQDKLQKAVTQFANADQLAHASFSFYVADGNTEKEVYSYNGSKGVSPASTQKIFTAIAAYDLLGQDYHFKTTIGYNGKIESGVLNGDLVIAGFGDPTLGSWRYDGFKQKDVQNRILQILSRNNIRAINGNIIVDETNFSMQPVPGGWPWNDMGNYYGAANWGINWNENQFDITYKPGKTFGDSISVLSFNPALPGVKILNLATTGQPDAGDNSYIFTSPYNPLVTISGSIPSRKNTTASGALPNPPLTMATQLGQWLQDAHIYCTGTILTGGQYRLQDKKIPTAVTILDTLSSPDMDQIVYWFLRKSINLYGESFAKVIGWEKGKTGETSAGVSLIRDYWSKRGIEKSALRMIDGSGLSPQNYVTAQAEVTAMLYAQKQNWFPAFYKALPIYNEMHMKSGTISACKAFTGYQTGSDGKKYVFSIIVNNYDGNSESLIRKIYRVLDILK